MWQEFAVVGMTEDELQFLLCSGVPVANFSVFLGF